MCKNTVIMRAGRDTIAYLLKVLSGSQMTHNGVQDWWRVELD
jgi:hypothetical protein